MLLKLPKKVEEFVSNLFNLPLILTFVKEINISLEPLPNPNGLKELKLAVLLI